MNPLRTKPLRAAALALAGAVCTLAGWPEASADGPAKGGAAPRVRTEPKSGLEVVSLPGGTFHFGCEPQDGDCSDDERPGRQVSVGAMSMGKTEVTVEAYGRCVAAGACTAPNSGGACNSGVAGRE